MSRAERPSIEVTLEEIASALGVSARRVQQLANLHVVKRAKGGNKYDLFASLTGYIRYLQDAMGKKSTMDGSGELTNTKHQRSRLLDVQLAREELELAKSREQVMAIDDHKLVMAHLIMETKARVMTIGARAAPKVLNQKTRAAIKKVIDNEAANTLVAMAKVELPMPAAVFATDPPAKKTAGARAKQKAAKKKTKRSSKSPTP